MDLSELKEIVDIFEASGLSEMEVEEGGHRVLLRKKFQQENVPAPIVMSPAPPQVIAAPPEMQIQVAHAQAAPPDEGPSDDGLITIDSPMVGTFYAAPAPGEPPFVSVGDAIEPDQTICIVEAMKIMNEVVAKAPGIIEKTLVENGEPVEYGQPLFAVRPLA